MSCNAGGYDAYVQNPPSAVPITPRPPGTRAISPSSKPGKANKPPVLMSAPSSSKALVTSKSHASLSPSAAGTNSSKAAPPATQANASSAGVHSNALQQKQAPKQSKKIMQDDDEAQAKITNSGTIHCCCFGG